MKKIIVLLFFSVILAKNVSAQTRDIDSLSDDEFLELFGTHSKKEDKKESNIFTLLCEFGIGEFHGSQNFIVDTQASSINGEKATITNNTMILDEIGNDRVVNRIRINRINGDYQNTIVGGPVIQTGPGPSGKCKKVSTRIF